TIFQCDKNNLVHEYSDTTARRGVDYYYYVVSKDDGSTNDVHPGVPLVSSKFYTLTNKPAYLRRPSGTNLAQIRVVPNPYVIDKRALQFGTESGYDRIMFYEVPPYCKIKIFTERGDLIKEIDHNNGTGDEAWESVTSSGQIIVSGLYIAYFEVTQDYTDPKTGQQLFKKGENTYRKFIVIR
ncbi:MAG: fibronectin, partial [candidate division KSB1 bacterium]|nr:fibronectin [candidate division KSB1 bacterium]